ncbi:hypothetical protein OIV83_003526 [Microbotryomycetes sp. JL201]|nr:hypothetical protein OIV83_003526 [Microbotryomycetes sp. JL201]
MASHNGIEGSSSSPSEAIAISSSEAGTPPRAASVGPSSPRSFGRLSQLASLFPSSPSTSSRHGESTAAADEQTSSGPSSWRLRNPIAGWATPDTRHDATDNDTPLSARIRNSADRLSTSFGERLSSHWPWRNLARDGDSSSHAMPNTLDFADEDDEQDYGFRSGDNDDLSAVIDDEACFVDGWEGKQIRPDFDTVLSLADFMASLPHELSLYILLHLEFREILTVAQVSRQWRALSQDNVLWRDLFHRNPNWRIRTELLENAASTAHSQPLNDYFSPTPLRTSSSQLLDPLPSPSQISLRSSVAGNSPDTPGSRRLHHLVSDMGALSLLAPNLSRSPSTQSARRLAAEQDPMTSRQALSRRPSANPIPGAAPSSVGTSTAHAYAFSTPVRPALSRASSRGSVSARSSLASSFVSLPPSPGPSRRPSCATIPPLGPVPSPSLHVTPSTPLHLDWPKLFRERFLLDRRWTRGEPKSTWLKGHTDSVYCIQFDDKHVISGSRDKTIRIWDLRTAECIKVLTGHEGSVLCLQFDSQMLVSGSSDSRILMWDLQGNSATGSSKYEIVRSMVGHAAGDTTIRIWHRETGELYRVLAGHRGPVNAVQLHGDKVISASGDSFMKMWDVKTGEVLRTFAGHERGLACVKLSSCGKYLASGSNDRMIKIWNAETGECIKTLRGHGDLVRSLAFDDVNGRIVSAGYDRTVRVWDLASGGEALKFRGHTSLVFDVAFSITRIISASHDQRILSMDFGAGLDTKWFV